MGRERVVGLWILGKVCAYGECCEEYKPGDSQNWGFIIPGANNTIYVNLKKKKKKKKKQAPG